MANQTGTYWIRIGSGSVVTCESLGLGPVSLDKFSLQPDVLTLRQRRRRGAWAVTIAHDEVVRFYRENAETTLEQLFVGRVISPVDSEDATGVARTIRVTNTLQFAREVMFHRGQWTPPSYSSGVPTGVTSEGLSNNGDHVSLFYGAVYTTTGSNKNRQLRRQTVTQAVQEVLDNLGLLVTREGVASGWGFTVGGNWFGSNPLAPSWSYEGPVSYLEMLIKAIQPVPDAFTAFDYTGSTASIRVGRYRDQTAVDLQETGFPTLGFSAERQRHEEVEGLVLAYFIDGTELDPANDFPVPGYRFRQSHGVWPASPAPSFLDRKVRTYTLGAPASATSAAILNYLGPSVTQPVVSANLTAAGGAWTWLKPGAVLDFGGLRLNVQTTRHDLAGETVTASMGLPRHLGVADVEQLQRWLQRWTRRPNGV